MEIVLVLRMHIDDTRTGTTRRLVKTVSGRLPHVPRVGEAVRIPGKTILEHLGARRVSNVIYTLEDEVILEFQLDGFVNEVDQQVATLTDAGFEEIADV